MIMFFLLFGQMRMKINNLLILNNSKSNKKDTILMKRFDGQI